MRGRDVRWRILRFLEVETHPDQEFGTQKANGSERGTYRVPVCNGTYALRRTVVNNHAGSYLGSYLICDKNKTSLIQTQCILYSTYLPYLCIVHEQIISDLRYICSALLFDRIFLIYSFSVGRWEVGSSLEAPPAWLRTEGRKCWLNRWTRMSG